MKKFSKKIITIALALMCMAVVGVVSASAATTEYWVNRPYSSAPVLRGSYSATSVQDRYGIKGNSSSSIVCLNDSKNRSLFTFNDSSFATKDSNVHRTGGDTSVSVNTKHGSYGLGNFSVLYNENGKVGGSSDYSISTPKTGTHYFTPAVSFTFD